MTWWMTAVWVLSMAILAFLSVSLFAWRRHSPGQAVREIVSSAEQLGRLRERREVVEWLKDRAPALAMNIADAEHTHRDRERAQA